MRLLPALIHFVKYTSYQYKIDESHAVGHAMNVLQYSQEILNASLQEYPYLKEQEPIIYTAALIHDMVDKKYREPTEAIHTIDSHLCNHLKPNEIETVKHIVSTMSYSTVKKQGFPLLGKYQMAYHIVREADLLAAYDFNRAIIYKMNHDNSDFPECFENSKSLFEKRMFQHEADGLFITKYSKQKSKELHENAKMQIASWVNIMNTYEKYNIVQQENKMNITLY
jgi:hypothetical protein